MFETLRVPLAVAAILMVAPYAAEAQRGGQIQLPDGAGREVIQARCVSCHGLNQVSGAAGYDQAGWKYVIEWAPQSEDRRDEGIRAAARGAAPQHCGRSGRQHLVHGQRQRHGWQAQSGAWRDYRLQNARSGRARSAHRSSIRRAGRGSRFRAPTWWVA